MKTLNLFTATLDEIIFEGRNKAYGAFVLRRLYSRHLAIALASTIALCLVLVSLPTLLSRLFPDPIVVPPLVTDPPVVTLMNVDVDRQPEPKTVAPAPTHPPVTVTPTTRTEYVVVKTLTKPEPTTEAVDPIIDGQRGPATGQIGDDLGPLIGTAGNGKGTDTNATAPPAPTVPFSHAEVMPEFAGGMQALQRYMQRNLRYPRQALANTVSGKVFVSFTVNMDGSITDVEVIKGLGYGTEEEASRVVRNMPPWTPGRQNNHAVPVRYTLPITFKYE
ncbi:energy transducer TonB [Hymenobacter sp. BT175]|uniref:energy transducer TonB n=1 Tax=Hymenobacter translucens TaxID=2886507 RepID=UPI001D0E74E5|nr:energy transducer TonB [Hymenobacter translucens]MCC2546124.1 energy transducer TonB [Hymenobacter translucens]